MRSALLRGREHTHLGTVAAVAEGRAAIALSPGGAAKTYLHTDPNEDAAVFAEGEAGWLVAVADGHGGFEAAEVALEHLLQNPAHDWTAVAQAEEAWRRQASAVLADAHRQIQEERSAAKVSSTTLALAVAAPGAGRLFWAFVGDSHIFRVRGDQVVDLTASDTTARRFFLGDPRASEERVRELCAAGVEPLAGVRALVLATDGLSEEGIGVQDPPAAVLEAVEQASRHPLELRALEVARGLVECALEAHRRNPSGDNAAVAALWLGERSASAASPRTGERRQVGQTQAPPAGEEKA